ncbi:MAG: glutamine--fructose-6-phosphate transaminase (isomerizing) [Bdellovibrionales bacterium]|nr:glutamine--fructose-6-phosphate transaminase (isomerizing) [Bdellovibrionales bacterium]
MCGIVGYVGKRPVVDLLLKGLGQLEYRGYDSTGIAVERSGEKKIEILKSEGKLENVARLAKELDQAAKGATCGMGHTRWATHGKPTTQNAHPHRTGHVVLVHNGIIENYAEIKREMASKGYHPVSETDSELFGFLVLEEMKAGKKLRPAVTASFRRITGSCSVVVMSDLEPGTVVGIRNGTPMVAATDPKGGGILASDAQPLLDLTKDVIFLEDGVGVEITEAGLKFFEFANDAEVRPATTHLDWNAENMEKGGYPTFMRKEIFEQPTAIVDTLNATLDRAKTEAFPLAKHRASDLLLAAEEIVFVACGTSWHAALLGKYWIEKYARIPVAVELASEFRYRDPVLKPKTLVIGITQSGETADTLAVLKDMKKRGVPTAAITNVRGSSISREADGTFFTAAGPEVGVASTKAFMAQLVTLLCFAGARSKVGPQAAGIDPKVSKKLFEHTLALPHAIQTFLGDEQGLAKQVKAIAKALDDAKGFFFIGRGYSFPMALEGALKLKELAYVYAEGYAAGELKHGPIAMIEEGMVVVVLAPKDSWRDKTVSNLEEVKARGAKIVSVGEAGDTHLRSLSDHWIPLPHLEDEALLPFAMAPVVQLLSYEIALLKGTNIDKPRNLAKSVTVE